jgi:hypothetical protein
MRVMGEELSRWLNIREKIKESYVVDKNWKESVDLFKSRIQNKFFDPMEGVIKEKRLKGEGFAIVTVQCALLESLAAFRHGKIFNHEKNEKSPSYEYRRSHELYIDFLNSADIFRDNFYTIDSKGKKQNGKPFKADDFYKNVRCGLIHEGKTKGNWTIKASKKKVKTEKLFIESNGQTISLYRTILHYRLKEYLDSYCVELVMNDNQNLRKYFARKLDHSRR